MTTILDILGTSTPVSEKLAKELGYVKAAIICRVFFYENLEDRVCKASNKSFQDTLGMSAGAVSKNLKWSLDNGWIKAVKPIVKGNRPNHYKVASKFYEFFSRSRDESKSRSRDESKVLNVSKVKVDVHEMNGKEESKENLNNEDKELALFHHFLEISKKRGPKSDMARDEWFADCEDILKLAGDDVDYAKELMTQARLDCIKAGYSFAKPGGLINWIAGILEKKEVEAKKESKTWYDGYELDEPDLPDLQPPTDLELQQIRAIAGQQFSFLDFATQKERTNGTLILEFPSTALEMAQHRKPKVLERLTGWMEMEDITDIDFVLIDPAP